MLIFKPPVNIAEEVNHKNAVAVAIKNAQFFNFFLLLMITNNPDISTAIAESICNIEISLN
jgi:hypothetical protein